jgi:thiol:disulfide interchange protein
MKRFNISLLFTIILNTAFSQFNFQDPVSWKFSAVDKGNGLYELHFKGNIEKPWHIYAIKLDQEGPIPTSIEWNSTEGFQKEGGLQEITKATKKYDPGFEFEVGMYGPKADLMQLVRVTSSKELTITGSIEYQSCNDETCLPPIQKEFSFTLAGIPAAVVKETKQTIKETPPVSETPESAEETVTDTFVLEETNGSGSLITETNPIDPLALAEDKSLTLFLLLAFLAGLAAILTPCVFPMIPMTVSFFMRGSTSRGLSILKGLVFGFSMILVYTGLGFVVGLTGMGAEAGTVLSTHWIPNLLFFLLFVVFAASFLGMFELIMPSGLINKADKQADKGGIIGAFFMGITTVLVSFSCTGPIVGSLLIESAGGLALKPILGMFFFSLAFALPFTILAIFPTMLKNLPKSGGWLNSIKVVLGFIVLAFSMKFLIAVDQSYHLNLISREIYLSIWFVLSILLGLYFLGKLKFSHDSDIPYVTVPRFALALVSFTFAMYLFTGILGAEMRTIASLIPPKSASALSFSSSAQQPSGSEQSSTYCGPGKYNERFKLPHGLLGYFNYEDGLKCAIENNKPIFLDFTGHSCSNCKQMESRVWSDPAVLKLLKEDYIIISLYTDDKTKLAADDIVIRADGKELRTIGELNKQFEIDKFNTIATPLYALLDHEGNLLAQPKGKDLNIQNFVDFLEEGKRNF